MNLEFIMFKEHFELLLPVTVGVNHNIWLFVQKY